jgi:hypothetical protein
MHIKVQSKKNNSNISKFKKLLPLIKKKRNKEKILKTNFITEAQTLKNKREDPFPRLKKEVSQIFTIHKKPTKTFLKTTFKFNQVYFQAKKKLLTKLYHITDYKKNRLETRLIKLKGMPHFCLQFKK